MVVIFMSNFGPRSLRTIITRDKLTIAVSASKIDFIFEGMQIKIIELLFVVRSISNRFMRVVVMVNFFCIGGAFNDRS